MNDSRPTGKYIIRESAIALVLYLAALPVAMWVAEHGDSDPAGNAIASGIVGLGMLGLSVFFAVRSLGRVRHQWAERTWLVRGSALAPWIVMVASWLVLLAHSMLTAQARRNPVRIQIELRHPAGSQPSPRTSIDFITARSVGGTPLDHCQRSEDGEFKVFTLGNVLEPGLRQRQLHVRQEGRPTQVFVLRLPRRPGPAPWVDWRSADELRTDPGGSPPGVACPFQIRYRIEAASLP